MRDLLIDERAYEQMPSTPMLKMDRTKRVSKELLAWYKTNGRATLPWRATRDPYRVLVSELMLQQTQVSRVTPKYIAFLKRFPTVHALAKANPGDVLRAWQGLGYNSRALRLHALAKRVSETGGAFPKSREELLALPGIGPYTAGAIVIFAYDEAELSVDVNVRRVLARSLIMPQKKADAATIDVLAQDMIRSVKSPHDWQSALMDLGATICVARNPACDACPIRVACANRGPRPEELIVDKKRTSAPFVGSNRWWRGRILRAILKRPAKEEALARAVLERPPTAEEESAFKIALNSLIADRIAARERDRILPVTE